MGNTGAYRRCSRRDRKAASRQDELADERFNEYAKPLSDLLIQVRKRLMTGYVIAGSMFGPLAFWFFSLLRRRFRGRTLVNFLERVPSAQGDVHRILSAVRRGSQTQHHRLELFRWH